MPAMPYPNIPHATRGPRWLLITAALLGCTGVGLAAYTSHGLGFITDPVAREAARATLQQAVQQQLLHAVVLLALGVWARQGQVAGCTWPPCCSPWGCCCSVG